MSSTWEWSYAPEQCEQKYERINNSGHIPIHTCSIRRQTPTENTIGLHLGVCACIRSDWTYFPRAVCRILTEIYTFLIYRQRQEMRKDKWDDKWPMMPLSCLWLRNTKLFACWHSSNQVATKRWRFVLSVLIAPTGGRREEVVHWS